MKAHGFYAKVKRLLPWRVRFLLGGEIVGSADRWSQVRAVGKYAENFGKFSSVFVHFYADSCVNSRIVALETPELSRGE